MIKLLSLLSRVFFLILRAGCSLVFRCSLLGEGAAYLLSSQIPPQILLYFLRGKLMLVAHRERELLGVLIVRQRHPIGQWFNLLSVCRRQLLKTLIYPPLLLCEYLILFLAHASFYTALPLSASPAVSDCTAS